MAIRANSVIHTDLGRSMRVSRYTTGMHRGRPGMCDAPPKRALHPGLLLSGNPVDPAVAQTAIAA